MDHILTLALGLVMGLLLATALTEASVINKCNSAQAFEYKDRLYTCKFDKQVR